jgi:dolichol-phosphate mannosyltransferase
MPSLKKALLTPVLPKFLFVGAIGVIINAAILSVQVEFLRPRPYLAVPLAFETSLVCNFVLNDKYTFHAVGGGKLLRLAKYNVSSILALLLQLASVYILTEFLIVHYLIASILGIGLGFVANYLLSLRIWRVDI